jgi:hypothetical protein
MQRKEKAPRLLDPGKGSVSVRWDGQVSPGLPLLHSHDGFLGSWKRKVNEFGLASTRERPTSKIASDRIHPSAEDACGLRDLCCARERAIADTQSLVSALMKGRSHGWLR